MLRRCLLVWVVASAACVLPSVASDAGEDAGLERCLGAEAGACNARGCVGLNGWRSTGAPSVIAGGGEYAGCSTPSDLGCGTTFTCATSPTDGVCWVFKDTCVPDGWARVSCAGPALLCPSIH